MYKEKSGKLSKKFLPGLLLEEQWKGNNFIREVSVRLFVPRIFREILRMNLEYTSECRKLLITNLETNDTDDLKIFRTKYKVLIKFDDAAKIISLLSFFISVLGLIVNIKWEIPGSVGINYAFGSVLILALCFFFFSNVQERCINCC